jgi:uncharacterized membrane protein
MKSSIIMREINTITVIAGLAVIFDYFYLSSFSKQFAKVFKEIQGAEMEVVLMSAAWVYLLMVFVIYYFGFVRKLSAIDMGILGVAIYGIYEWTNHATIKDWPYWMVAVDSLWGGILFYSVFSLSKLIMSKV